MCPHDSDEGNTQLSQGFFFITSDGETWRLPAGINNNQILSNGDYLKYYVLSTSVLIRLLI